VFDETPTFEKVVDVLARVAPSAHRDASKFEVEVARRLAEVDGPVAQLEPRVEPRVYFRDNFAISFWTYYEPVGSEIAPAHYADALVQYHAPLRQVDLRAPHFTDRVAGALREVGDREQTPALLGPDRELLTNTLSSVSTAISSGEVGEQLLHGEPHPGNLLNTRSGPLFVDPRHAAVGRSSSTSPMLPKKLESSIRRLITT
jgi:hypothetical protein